MFNREAFIQNEVLTGNLTIDEANKVLKDAGQQEINPLLGKLATQKWLSPTLAGVGGLAAAPLAPVTLGGSSALGGLGGYGLGEMIKTEAGNWAGLSPNTQQGQYDQLSNSVNNAVTAGVTTGSLADIAMLLNSLRHPITSLSNTRTKIWNKSEPISYKNAQTGLTGAADRAALPENKMAAEEKATDLFSKWFPKEGTSTIPKQTAFERLRDWENNNRVWTRENPQPMIKKATQDVSSQARSLLRGGDWKVGALNKAIGTLEGLQPYKKWIIGAGIGLPLVRSAIYGLINSFSSDSK